MAAPGWGWRRCTGERWRGSPSRRSMRSRRSGTRGGRGRVLPRCSSHCRTPFVLPRRCCPGLLSSCPGATVLAYSLRLLPSATPCRSAAHGHLGATRALIRWGASVSCRCNLFLEDGQVGSGGDCPSDGPASCPAPVFPPTLHRGGGPPFCPFFGHQAQSSLTQVAPPTAFPTRALLLFG